MWLFRYIEAFVALKFAILWLTVRCVQNTQLELLTDGCRFIVGQHWGRLFTSILLQPHSCSFPLLESWISKVDTAAVWKECWHQSQNPKKNYIIAFSTLWRCHPAIFGQPWPETYRQSTLIAPAKSYLTSPAQAKLLSVWQKTFWPPWDRPVLGDVV